MRTKKEFTEIFYDILNNKLPDGKKEVIFTNWGNNQKTKLFLEDSETDKWCKTNRDSVPYAAVLVRRNIPIYDGIAFREFVRNESSDKHLRAIIQHELVHCFRNSLMRIAMSVSYDAAAQILGRESSRQKEERETSRVNKGWGCDDQEAVRWCEAWVAMREVGKKSRSSESDQLES